jgi:hypothetical protein
VIDWQLPPAPRQHWWIDAPEKPEGPEEPPKPADVRRDGLWIIEGEDTVWDAPLAGTW